MDRVFSFDRLLSIPSSPANLLTFCVRCFAELGANIIDLLDRYRVINSTGKYYPS